MFTPPPPLSTTPRVPAALSICAGLAGVATAIGAGFSGFLRDFANLGFNEFYWGEVVPFVAVVALVGGVLALMQHEAGGPIVAGSGIVMAVVVAVTVLGDTFDLENFLDLFPLRGLAFLAAGVTGTVATVLGLCCLRGRGSPAMGIAPSAAAIGVLVCQAALFHLDDRRPAFVVRPFVGIALIIAVMVLGSFVGRSGSLTAAAGAACLYPLYDVVRVDGFLRWQAAVVASVCLGLVIGLSVLTAVVTLRRTNVQSFGRTQPAYPQDWAAEPDRGIGATAQLPAWDMQQTQQFPASTFDAPSHAGGTGAPLHTLASPDYERPAAEPVRLPPIAEATTTMGAFYQPDPLVGDTASTAFASASASPPGSAQWSSDPYGRHQLRYWDGQQWTSYVSDNGVSSMDPL